MTLPMSFTEPAPAPQAPVAGGEAGGAREGRQEAARAGRAAQEAHGRRRQLGEGDLDASRGDLADLLLVDGDVFADVVDLQQVVIDDTLFKRWGRRVHHAFWTHDGAAQGGKKIARGQTVSVQVRNPDGMLSNVMPFMRPL